MTTHGSKPRSDGKGPSHTVSAHFRSLEQHLRRRDDEMKRYAVGKKTQIEGWLSICCFAGLLQLKSRLPARFIATGLDYSCLCKRSTVSTKVSSIYGLVRQTWWWLLVTPCAQRAPAGANLAVPPGWRPFIGRCAEACTCRRGEGPFTADSASTRKQVFDRSKGRP